MKSIKLLTKKVLVLAGLCLLTGVISSQAANLTSSTDQFIQTSPFSALLMSEIPDVPRVESKISFSADAEGVTISGQVFTADGVPMADAIVTMKDEQGNYHEFLVTDSSGSFRFSNVTMDEICHINAYANGFYFVTQDVIASEDLVDLVLTAEF